MDLLRKAISKYAWRLKQLPKRALLTLTTALLLLICGITYLWYAWQHPSLAELKKLNAVPYPGDISKALVMAKTKHENVRWAYNLAPDWISYIYTADHEPGYPLTMPNKGREAMAYLTFIIDYYEGLPEYTAFVHSASYQWHNDVLSSHTEDLITKLRLKTVQKQGYVNLRCSLNPGCPFAVFPKRPTETDIKNNDTRAHMVEIYQSLFGGTEEDIPDEIGGVCCAQFVVSRDKIRERPRSDYIRMREWALNVHLDTFGIGWVFEKVWHIVFNKPAQFCPSYEQCRCDLYGWCGGPKDEEE